MSLVMGGRGSPRISDVVTADESFMRSVKKRQAVDWGERRVSRLFWKNLFLVVVVVV
jgi:hypothetical protein